MWKDADPNYFPGTRLLVYDTRAKERRPATVLYWYGKRTKYGIYESLVDVVFDHDQRTSCAHFADPFWVSLP